MFFSLLHTSRLLQPHALRYLTQTPLTPDRSGFSILNSILLKPLSLGEKNTQIIWAILTLESATLSNLWVAFK